MSGTSRKFSRRLLCLAVASACAGSAFAAPIGPVVSAGSATYAPATLTVTSTSARTQISWQSFNVAVGEVVKFVQPGAQSSVLNHVFSPQSPNILGGISSNGSVLFMSNGVVSGPGMSLDLAGAVNTSLRLPGMALALSQVARPAGPTVLTTLDEGSILVIGQDQQSVAMVSGEVVLNPGRTVELAQAAKSHLRVELTAPGAEAINLSRLVAGKRETGIYAALFRIPASARQATQTQADTQLAASAGERTPDTADAERFYRYALLYARMQGEAPQHDGGMLRVAAAPTGRMMLPALKSRPSLLPNAIELGAPAAQTREAGVEPASSPVPASPGQLVATLEPQPIPAMGENEPERNRVTLLALAPHLIATETVATLEPQPIPAMGENEPERNRVTLLALAPDPVAAEVVATLEPQPIPALGENEPERNRVTLLALAPNLIAAETVATLEPQPIPAMGENEPERNRVTLLALAPGPVVTEAVATLEPQPIPAMGENEPERNRATLLALAHAPGVEGDPGPDRKARNAAPAVIVVALAQHSATPAAQDDANVKEVRIERRAPRYFTDYRGAMFFM